MTFNRSYQRAHRTVREAGGGHRVAADYALRLPWAGIFEPWKPAVMVAAAKEEFTARTKNVLVRTKNVPVGTPKAANRCKKGSGRLQGVQLDLFPDIGAQEFTGCEKIDTPVKNLRAVSAPDPPPNDRESAADSKFPSLAGVEVPIDEDRPLFDLFPEAYL